MQPIDLSKERQEKCSLDCPILDAALNGGIPCGSITEFFGESSSAKTQLCLQLLLTVQLPIADGGLEGSALYVYTENYFASSRLRQLAAPQSIGARANHRRCHRHVLPGESTQDRFGRARRLDRHAHPYDVYGPPEKLRTIDPDTDDTDGEVVNFDPCKNVYVQGLQTAEELLKYLDYSETLLSHPLRMPVRLLVIDSIAALFRTDFDNRTISALTGRGNLFFQISSKLKKLAEKYNLAIVVTNQVTDYFESTEAPRRRDAAAGASLAAVGTAEVLFTSGRRVVPSLGISWAHCVNTRLFLSRFDLSSNRIWRTMQVVFAPHLANVTCNFVVDADGVKGIARE
ncbi:unnamed protein product [Calypogeia fissa]